MQALKEKDQSMVSTLRLAKAALQKAAIDAKRSPDDDTLAISVLQQEAKKREDAIAAYRQGGRADLADREHVELDIIRKLLPPQLSDENVRLELQKLLTQTDSRDFGALMKLAMQQLQGRAGGKQVSTILKQMLSV